MASRRKSRVAALNSHIPEFPGFGFSERRPARRLRPLLNARVGSGALCICFESESSLRRLRVLMHCHCRCASCRLYMTVGINPACCCIMYVGAYNVYAAYSVHYRSTSGPCVRNLYLGPASSFDAPVTLFWCNKVARLLLLMTMWDFSAFVFLLSSSFSLPGATLLNVFPQSV